MTPTGEHDPDPPTEDVLQVSALVDFLRDRGRVIYLDGGIYRDETCPVAYRHAVTIGSLDSDAVILRCQAPCDRPSMLESYGLGKLATQIRVEAREEELRVEYLAQQGFATWLQEQEARR